MAQQVNAALDRDDVARRRVAGVLQAGAHGDFTRIDVAVFVLVVVREWANQPRVHRETKRVARAAGPDRRIRLALGIDAERCDSVGDVRAADSQIPPNRSLLTIVVVTLASKPLFSIEPRLRRTVSDDGPADGGSGNAISASFVFLLK